MLSRFLKMLRLLLNQSRGAREEPRLKGLDAAAARRAGYSLVFVKQLRPRLLGLWRVRDGPGGGFVLFASREDALRHAERLLAGRRGQVIEE
jgi:hypothetical protein